MIGRPVNRPLNRSVNHPLQIVLPIHSFEPGGVERVALNLAAAWQAAGEAVTILLGRRDGAAAATAPRLDYVCRESRVPTAPFETLWMIWSLWRFLARRQADVLFCPGNTYAVVGAVMKLLLGRKCPPVAIKISNDLQRHDMPWFGRLAYRLWLRLQGRLFDCVIAMSPNMRNEIARLMNLPPDRIVTIDNAAMGEAQYAALAAIARDGRPRPDRRYLAIGRLVPQKNYVLMLRAFARGAAPGSSLTILGEGLERGRLEELVTKLGLAGRVAMPGHNHDTVACLREADTLLLSSDYEGVPSVVVEALAAGMPVIATNCCVSMAGLVGNGRFGQLVAPGDETAFAHAIARAGDSLFSLQAARAKAAAFTVERVAPRYLAAFRAMLGMRNRAPQSSMQDNKSVI